MRRSPRSITFCIALVSIGAAVALFWAASHSLAAEPAAKAIAFGPYVYDVTPTSAVIRWATATASAPASPDAAAGAPAQTVYEFHEKELTGLKPGSVNAYDVLGNRSPEESGSVTTLPEGAAPFRFIAYGDTRTRADVQQRIVNRVIAEKPLFVVNTGDLVSDGKKVADWEIFMNVNRELMRNTLYMPVLGNHERNGEMFFKIFRGSEEERYKAVKVGDVLLLMLDSEGTNETGDAAARLRYMEKQKAWVEKTLNENANVGYIFPSFHKPLYCVMTSRVPETKVRREFWGDIFERHGVQVVLQGHDHHYHHAAHGGTHYVTCAGGGAPLYEINALQPETVKAVKVEHYLTIDIGGDVAKITATDIDGNEIDQFEIARR